MKVLLIFILFLWGCTISSCVGFSDSSKSLGNGYTLRLGENNQHLICPTFIVYPVVDSIGWDDHYILLHQIVDFKSYHDYFSFDFKYKINRYMNDHKFVHYPELDSITMDTIIHRYNLTNLDNTTLQYYKTIEVISDSILKNNPFYVNLMSRQYVYWIIDKTQQKKYGPFDFKTIGYEKEKRRILKNSTETLLLNPSLHSCKS